jgi:hypothetical protein
MIKGLVYIRCLLSVHAVFGTNDHLYQVGHALMKILRVFYVGQLALTLCESVSKGGSSTHANRLWL